MSESDGHRLRHSKAEAPKVLLTEQERAEREARNALLQAKRLEDMIEAFVIEPERKFRLRPSAILDLNRLAIEGFDAFAGNWRPGSVEISGSEHQPPAAHLVPELAEQMCDYINDNWGKRAAHLAACDVENELDPCLHRWEWPNGARCFLSRALNSLEDEGSGRSDHTGDDHGQPGALL